MNKLKVTFIFLLALASCTSLKEQVQNEDLKAKLSQNFTIEKLPNWDFHAHDDVLNYTPTDLMKAGNEYIYNTVSVYKSENPSDTDLNTYITNLFENSKFKSAFDNIETTAIDTKYGPSIVVTYDATFGAVKYKTRRQFYKHNKYIYEVLYRAKNEYYDTYFTEATQMMDTFNIDE